VAAWGTDLGGFGLVEAHRGGRTMVVSSSAGGSLVMTRTNGRRWRLGAHRGPTDPCRTCQSDQGDGEWLETASDGEVLGGKELHRRGSSWEHDGRRLRPRTVARHEALDGARG
jgi:hypothetical protein